MCVAWCIHVCHVMHSSRYVCHVMHSCRHVCHVMHASNPLSICTLIYLFKKKSYIRIPLHMDAYLPVFLGRTLRTNSSMRGALLCVLGSFGHWNGHMCLKWSCLLGTEMGMFVIQLWCLFRKPNASRLQSSSLSLHACVAHTLVCWAFFKATLLTWAEGASR